MALMISTVVGAGAHHLHAQNNQSADQSIVLTDLAQRLISEQAGENQKAAEQSASWRGALINALVRNLESLKKEATEKPQRFNGPLHLTIRAIEQWRVEEAADSLVEIISLKLDSKTFPVGARYGSTSFYPAASALAKIGGQRVTKALQRNLAYTMDDNSIQITAWILTEIYGREIAQLIVQQQKVITENTLKNIGGALKNTETVNADKILLILQGKDPVVLPK